MYNITTINDPHVRDYLTLKQLGSRERFSDDKFFIAEGKKVVKRLLQSGVEIDSFFSTFEHFEEFRELILSRVAEDKIYLAEKSVMNEIVGFKLHAGILALAKEPDEAGFADFGNNIVVLNALADPENVGAIVRNAAAFRINSIIYDNKSCSPYLRRAVRVSLGNIFNCRHRRSDDLKNDLLYLRSEFGYLLIAAEITNTSVSLDSFKFPAKYVVIFGSEGYGVSPEILKICDYIVHIPINLQCDSINVAASSAVFFHSMLSQQNENCL